MRTPQPKTNSSDLIERLNSLNENPSEFALRRIMDEAEKLKSVDAPSAYMVMGMVKSMAKDEHECFKYFKAATTLSNDPVIGVNWSRAYCRFGKMADSFRIALANYHKHPSDPESLDEAISAATRAGEIDAFNHLVNRWKMMMPDDADKHENCAEMFGKFSEQLINVYAGLCKEVAVVLQEFHTIVRKWTMKNTDDGAVAVFIGVDASPVETAELNLAIADKMSALESACSNEVLFVCIPNPRAI